MNLEKLREITRSGALADAVFENLSSRIHDNKSIDLRRLLYELRKSGVQVTGQAELVEFFRKLQAAGFGKVMARKHTNDPFRFVWSTPMLRVAEEAKKLRVEPPRDADGARDVAKAELRRLLHIAPGQRGGTLPFSCTLRRNFTLAFELPDDVTNEELDILISQLQRLKG